MPSYTPTTRTRHRRIPARGSYDRTLVHSILDEAIVCHIGFEHEGQPFVLPTTFARVGETLYVHGAAASRMLGVLRKGVPVCVTVTLVDGLVFSRSWFHQSMNYRSVVVLGEAREVTNRAEKLSALRSFVERVSPGMSERARPPTAKELAATRVLAMPLEEVSAKTRDGGPKEEPEDEDAQVYSGHVPIELAAREPVAEPGCVVAAPPLPRQFRRVRDRTM